MKYEHIREIIITKALTSDKNKSSSFSLQKFTNLQYDQTILVQTGSLNMNSDLFQAKEQHPTILSTNIYEQQPISYIHDNLSIFINNIILVCKLQQTKILSVEQSRTLKNMLKKQLSQLWFEQKLKKFTEVLSLQQQKHEFLQTFQKKLYEMQQIIRVISQQKHNTQTEGEYIHFENQMNKYLQFIYGFITSKNIKDAIYAFKLNPQSKQDLQYPLKQSSEIDIPPSHFFKESISTKIDYKPIFFNQVRPENHKFYVTQAAKIYNEIAPFKLKHISLSINDGPVINRPNYLSQNIDPQKAKISICIPYKNKIGFYYLADLCNVHTFSKELYHERILSNQWAFSSYTKSIITETGNIYAVNCKTTRRKIDPYFYFIGETKASNRGPLPAPKRDNSLVYLNENIYVIGGQGEGETCSKIGFRYSLKQKKWHPINDSIVGVRKSTVCTVNSRYILKLGGLNQFGNISKHIQMYDSLTNCWSLVKVSPKNNLQQVQILQDSHAIQINDDQVYIFGGKNANRFSTDTGFVLIISEIKQRRRGAAKVTGQLWNVSVDKRNIFTFFGQFSSSNVILHYNCIYGLRSNVASNNFV